MWIGLEGEWIAPVLSKCVGVWCVSVGSPWDVNYNTTGTLG